MSRVTPLEFVSKNRPIWCAGCGDYGALGSLYYAFARLSIPPERLVIVSGIGCSGRLPGFVNCYGFHAVHGRALPVAIGVKVANPDLTVVVISGDGDALAIGGGHLPHAIRKNPDITLFILDNNLYGQTKGQTSPTADPHIPTRSTPYLGYEEPLDPLLLGLACNATFIGRGYTGRSEQLVDLVVSAIRHRGFSLVQILSPCIIFNDRQVYRRIEGQIRFWHPQDRVRLFEKLIEAGEIPLGVLYKGERPTLEDRLKDIRDRAKDVAGV